MRAEISAFRGARTSPVLTGGTLATLQSTSDPPIARGRVSIAKARLELDALAGWVLEVSRWRGWGPRACPGEVLGLLVGSGKAWLRQGLRRAPGARATEGEIQGGGTRNERSRPAGGELKNLVEPIGIEPTTS